MSKTEIFGKLFFLANDSQLVKNALNAFFVFQALHSAEPTK